MIDILAIFLTMKVAYILQEHYEQCPKYDDLWAICMPKISLMFCATFIKPGEWQQTNQFVDFLMKGL